jgi:hypothetical protein
VIEVAGITNVNNRLMAMLRSLIESSTSFDIQQLKASAHNIAAAASTDASAEAVSNSTTLTTLMLLVPPIALACTRHTAKQCNSQLIRLFHSYTYAVIDVACTDITLYNFWCACSYLLLLPFNRQKQLSSYGSM